MRTIVIDVTSFDQDEATKGTRVVYGFRQEDLDEPLATINAFVTDPSRFLDGEYRAILTVGQDARLRAYLRAGGYRCEPFEQKEMPEYLLALSYGESPDVNMQLAKIVEEAVNSLGSLTAFVQWEIANILSERNPNYRDIVNRIDFDYDRDYVTSVEVVEKFKRAIGRDNELRVFLVCQAWHAPRCIQICKSQGLRVVRGRFVDEFSRSGRQKWVRNWLAWVLKEGANYRGG